MAAFEQPRELRPCLMPAKLTLQLGLLAPEEHPDRNVHHKRHERTPAEHSKHTHDHLPLGNACTTPAFGLLLACHSPFTTWQSAFERSPGAALE
jgi:hypothetical protein